MALAQWAILYAEDGLTGPILDVYGISPNPGGVYMARWFGPFNALGWIAVGLNLRLGAGFASLQRPRLR